MVDCFASSTGIDMPSPVSARIPPIPPNAIFLVLFICFLVIILSFNCKAIFSGSTLVFPSPLPKVTWNLYSLYFLIGNEIYYRKMCRKPNLQK